MLFSCSIQNSKKLLFDEKILFGNLSTDMSDDDTENHSLLSKQNNVFCAAFCLGPMLGFKYAKQQGAQKVLENEESSGDSEEI